MPQVIKATTGNMKYIQSMLKRFCSGLIDVFFPRICANCEMFLKTESVVCFPCHSAITFLEGSFCIYCSAPLADGKKYCAQCLDKRSYLTDLASVFEYNASSKTLVTRLKTYGEKENVQTYANWMFERGHALITRTSLIIPVPLHGLRLLSRKFNQAALLARALSELCGVPVEMFTLRKTVNTKRQSQLSSNVRARNVLNSFAVSDTGLVVGMSIMLVDDVVTTGATLQSCAQTLLRAGAAEVTALTLARSLRNARK